MAWPEEDKQWLSDLLDRSIRQSEARLDQKLDQLRTDLRAEFSRDVEKVETRLLTAFHEWASPAEMRIRRVGE